jgi:hypothetical protein
MKAYPAHFNSLNRNSDLNDLDKLPRLQILGENPKRDNDARASYAASALVEYAAVVGDPMVRGREELGETIADLLGDLRHLCDALKINYEAAILAGMEQYDQELYGEVKWDGEKDG